MDGMDSVWAAAARLVRRTGFGATGAEVDAAAKEGTDSYVARMLAADPTVDPGAKRTPAPSFPQIPTRKTGGAPDDEAKKQRRGQLREQNTELTAWWLRRMIAAEQPFGEKATFVWHWHFATSLKKVKVPALMLAQNARQRGLGRHDFRTLAYTMLTDGATQVWLDNQKNTVKGPNENLSREFMEVFTLGHADGYTEKDVREGARALTGYKLDRRDGTIELRPQLRDTGAKTVLGRTGDLDARGFCDAVLAQPGCAPYVVTRLYSRFVSSTAPSKSVLARLVDAYGPERDLGALFTAMFTASSFQDADGTYVIGPVEWLIGAARALRTPTGKDDQLRQYAATLDSLGQLPFFPPSVGGWPTGAVWMTTAAADLRFRAAAALARPADLDELHGSTTAKLEALAHRLGVPTWSAETLGVLKGAASEPRQLVAVALNTPEYLVH